MLPPDVPTPELPGQTPVGEGGRGIEHRFRTQSHSALDWIINQGSQLMERLQPSGSNFGF